MSYKVIKLKYPPNENLKEIRLRRPKVKDYRQVQNWEGDEIDRDLLFFEMLTGVSKEILEELDIEDWNALQNALVEMTGNLNTPRRIDGS